MSDKPNRVDGKFKLPVEFDVKDYLNRLKTESAKGDEYDSDDAEYEPAQEMPSVYNYLSLAYDDMTDPNIVDFEALIDVLDIDIEDITGECFTMADTEGDMYIDFSAFEAWTARSCVDYEKFISETREGLLKLILDGVENITGERPDINPDEYTRGHK